MKKLTCILVAMTLLFCSSTSIQAVDDVNMTTDSSTYLFRSCTFCGGTVYLYCTGVEIPNLSYTANDCSITRHNENDLCDVEHVYCGTAGYCVNCPYDSDVVNPQWPYETEHHHVERHHFDASIEEWGSCLYS